MFYYFAFTLTPFLLHYANNIFSLIIVCALCAFFKNKLNFIDLLESKNIFEELHDFKNDNKTGRQEELQQIFSKTLNFLNLNKISLIFSSQADSAQSVYTGKQQGIIFVDEKIIETLSLKQSLAIIMHELAHIIFNHHEKKLFKMVLLDCALIFSVLITTSFIENVFFQNNIEKEWVYLASCPIFWAAGLLGKKITETFIFNLEFQADHFAASMIDSESFLSALNFCLNNERNLSLTIVQNNLNLINKIYTNIRLPAKTHPSINQRIKMLNKHFNKNHYSNK